MISSCQALPGAANLQEHRSYLPGTYLMCVPTFRFTFRKGSCMKMFNAMVAMLLAVATSQVAAGGLIDSFDSPAQFVVSVPGLDVNNAIAPQALGGWRELTAFGQLANLTGTTGVFDGSLVFGNGPAGFGLLQVEYTSNNLGLGGGLGTDLTSGGATQFSIDVVADDTIPTILQYRVEDVFGGVSTFLGNIGGSAAGTSFITPFAAFSGNALFGQAKFLTMSIAGAANADITLDNLQANNPVPEPSSLAIALSALAIGGVYMRKRKKQQQLIA